LRFKLCEFTYYKIYKKQRYPLMITEKLSELNNLESYDDDSENKLGDMLCANTDYIY